jgi:hypothetical protein
MSGPADGLREIRLVMELKHLSTRESADKELNQAAMNLGRV